MTPKADELLRQVRESPEERIEIAESLLAGVEPPNSFWTPEFRAEMDRRWARIESGEDRMYSWEEVQEWIRSRKEARSGG